MEMEDPDIVLAQDMAKFYADPLGFVMYAFPWDTDSSLQIVKLPEKYREKYDCIYGPDEWACDVLEKVGEEVKKRNFDGKNAVDAIRAAVTSGHGIGKSALTSWLILWIMSTRPHAQGTVTANTYTQLQTKTWAQLSKWHKKCITGHWFICTNGKGSMLFFHKQHKSSWFCTAQTCDERNSEAFAGQHAANSTSFYFFDEASAISDIIKEVAEGGMTDGEPMMFAFGNPTRPTGWFRECFGKLKHRWMTWKIDSRTVQITNKKTLQEWIDDNGEDSDFVKVRIKGEFPSSAINQLISSDVVEKSLKRVLKKEQYEFAPVILGVDPAWQGGDRSCVFMRQGLATKVLGVWNGINNVDLAGMVGQFWDDYKADAVFIDIGWGAGVIDILKSSGRNPIAINFGERSLSPEYANKRTQMWCELKKWVEGGGALDPNPKYQSDLMDDLTGPEYHFKNDGAKMLESKESMRGRGIRSPDLGDGLALTFAFPVQKQSEIEKLKQRHGNGHRVQTDYKLFD